MKRNDLVVGQSYAIHRKNDYLGGGWGNADRATVVDTTTQLKAPFRHDRERVITLADGTRVRTNHAVEAAPSERGNLIPVRYENGEIYFVPQTHIRSTWSQYVSDSDTYEASRRRHEEQAAAAKHARSQEKIALARDAVRHGITLNSYDFEGTSPHVPFGETEVSITVAELRRLLAIADQAAATQEA
jgi:hypothetical protein